jgi:serine protease inhibitor
MRATLARAAVAAGDGWQAVRLPYEGNALAMTVVLPDAGRQVDPTELPTILAAPRPGGVELELPRWTFRTKVSLKGVLAALGMPTAFDEARADFTAMTESDEHLLIEGVYHQVYVAVGERGTEAAAATAVGMGTTSAILAEHRLVVDRPFLFVIHDVEHGTPLFVGRVDDPRG